jgi:hypothetical protein
VRKEMYYQSIPDTRMAARLSMARRPWCRPFRRRYARRHAHPRKHGLCGISGLGAGLRPVHVVLAATGVCVHGNIATCVHGWGNCYFSTFTNRAAGTAAIVSLMVSRVRFQFVPDILPHNATDNATALLFDNNTHIYTRAEVVVTLTFTVGLLQVGVDVSD